MLILYNKPEENMHTYNFRNKKWNDKSKPNKSGYLYITERTSYTKYEW
jgi:hypothetical protein